MKAGFNVCGNHCVGVGLSAAAIGVVSGVDSVAVLDDVLDVMQGVVMGLVLVPLGRKRRSR